MSVSLRASLAAVATDAASRSRKTHRSPTARLCDLPGIAEFERLLRGSGQWLTEAELQQRANQLSAALFGITEADTRKVPLDAYQVLETGPLWITPEHEAAIAASYRQSYAWEVRFLLATDIIAGRAVRRSIGGVGLIGDDGRAPPCLRYFIRQLIAIEGRLLPGARLHPAGEGKRKLSTEEWAASLEREARVFKSLRSGQR